MRKSLQIIVAAFAGVSLAFAAYQYKSISNLEDGPSIMTRAASGHSPMDVLVQNELGQVQKIQQLTETDFSGENKLGGEAPEREQAPSANVSANPGRLRDTNSNRSQIRISTAVQVRKVAGQGHGVLTDAKTGIRYEVVASPKTETAESGMKNPMTTRAVSSVSSRRLLLWLGSGILALAAIFTAWYCRRPGLLISARDRD